MKVADPRGDTWEGNQKGQEYGQSVHNEPYVWPSESMRLCMFEAVKAISDRRVDRS